MKKLSENFQKETHALKKENASLMLYKSLKKKIADLKAQVDKVEIAADSNEQYSRRNNLRISGRPFADNKKTDEIVLKLARDVGVNLNIWDIDRSSSWADEKRSTCYNN